MMGFGPLLKKEIVEQLRTHRLLIVGVIFLFFGLTTPLLLYYMPEIMQMAGVANSIEIPRLPRPNRWRNLPVRSLR
jgi:ABC-2 type transport system permease protein